MIASPLKSITLPPQLCTSSVRAPNVRLSWRLIRSAPPRAPYRRVNTLDNVVYPAMSANNAAPVAVLWDRGARPQWQAAQEAAQTRGWKLLSLEIKDAAELDAAFKAATDARAGALLVHTGQIAFPNRKRIAELAAKSRLPAMYDLRPYVDAGGLISYGANLNHIWVQAARFVDKLLKGAKPADLPVEHPTRFELIINLKATSLSPAAC